MTDTATIYLSTAQYREATGLAERTLKRYQAPVNVDRDAAAGNRAIVAAHNAARRELEARPTLEDVLARASAYVPLDEASQLLGVPPFVIRKDPQAFDALVYGGKGHRTILVPQATIRRVAGI